MELNYLIRPFLSSIRMKTKFVIAIFFGCISAFDCVVPIVFLVIKASVLYYCSYG